MEKESAKKDLVTKYRTHKNDTGSSTVQIAILTDKIKSLTDHLKEHSHDHDSKRGLLMMIGKRRRLLNYIKKDDLKAYEKLIADLKLRK